MSITTWLWGLTSCVRQSHSGISALTRFQFDRLTGTGDTGKDSRSANDLTTPTRKVAAEQVAIAGIPRQLTRDTHTDRAQPPTLDQTELQQLSWPSKKSATKKRCPLDPGKAIGARSEPRTGAEDARQQTVLGAPRTGLRGPSQVGKEPPPATAASRKPTLRQHKDEPFPSSSSEERKTLEHHVDKRMTFQRDEGSRRVAAF